MSPEAKKIKKWRKDPVQFVRDQFNTEPDEWQKDALYSARDNLRTAMSACKGPGKSCVLAWIIWWFLVCFVNAQVMVLSITKDNLKDNIWKELAYWRGKSVLLQSVFDMSGERIASVDPERERYWWCSARSFAKDADPDKQSVTLAGFHGENLMVVLDECGDIPTGVLSAAEAIFSTEGSFARLIAAGNPTNPRGALGHIVHRERKKWIVISITGDPDDPKRSPRINKQWAQDMIDQWGRDNPWVMVNVLGLFPHQSIDTLLSDNDVTIAINRDATARDIEGEPNIWALDVGRYGDDESSLARRKGIVAFKFITWRNKNGTELGDEIAALIIKAEEEGNAPDVLFIDIGGVGASVYDRLEVLGYGYLIVAVDFAGAPSDEKFLNKRAEMWWSMAHWIQKRPSCLPNDAVLAGELPAPKYKFKASGKKTKFVLESKEDMKARGVPSPNRADSLAMTWHSPVIPREIRERTATARNKVRTQYNPLSRGNRKVAVKYDPLRR